MAAATQDVYAEIRKLRKKLRQIENLERSTRQLSEEEEIKVERKHEIRDELLDLISQQGDITVSSNYSENTTLESNTSILENRPSKNITSTEGGNSYDTSVDNSYADATDAGHPIDVRETTPSQTPADVSLPAAPPSKNVANVNNSASGGEREQVKETSTTSAQTQKGNAHKHGKESQKSSVDGERHRWRSTHFSVHTLEGHNDLITDVDTNGKILVSSSRDTTIKVWDLSTFTEVKNFGGHTDMVTSVQLLSDTESLPLCEVFDSSSPDDTFIVSGSLDCSIRVWSLKTGQMVKEVYTFDPIQRLQYFGGLKAVFTGSVGGKVAIWSIESGEAIYSVCAHQEALSALKFYNPYLYTASEDGLIQVHELRDQKLFRLFISENVQMPDGRKSTLRIVNDLTVKSDKIFYGDDGDNLKVLDWKAGIVKKLRNNLGEFGFTDAVCCHDNLLLATGYDLDNGLGFINVRCFDHSGEYLGTLTDEQTGRIMCLTCKHEPMRRLVIGSGGQELKVWIKLHGSEGSENSVYPKFISSLSESAVDSDIDSDSDNSDIDGATGHHGGNRKRLSLGNLNRNENKGWGSWCSIL